MANNNPIRVLIADDSFFVRTLIRAILEKEPDIQIIGEARDGLEAVANAAKLNPDVITMDYNMPELNGEQATVRILENSAQPPAIVMFSASTREGADITMRCLRSGVVDFLTKPSGEVSVNLDSISTALVEKIRIAAKAKVRRPGHFKIQKVRNHRFRTFYPKVVIIGSSTGGPPVVEYILSNLPPNLTVPILIVQHMPEKFTAFFAERLNRIVPFTVKEAEEGDVLKGGVCYVAPGNWHMEIKANHLHKFVHLTKTEPYLGLRPAINRTMLTAVECYDSAVLGIILTGMGNDGTEGIEAIKNKGGMAVAQEPETAVVDSMPMSIIKRGLTDDVMLPHEIVEMISQFNI